MLSQVDMRNEGRALQRLSRNFGRAPRIIFPTPLHFTREILVETFEVRATILPCT